MPFLLIFPDLLFCSDHRNNDLHKGNDKKNIEVNTLVPYTDDPSERRRNAPLNQPVSSI